MKKDYIIRISPILLFWGLVFYSPVEAAGLTGREAFKRKHSAIESTGDGHLATEGSSDIEVARLDAHEGEGAEKAAKRPRRVPPPPKAVESESVAPLTGTIGTGTGDELPMGVATAVGAAVGVKAALIAAPPVPPPPPLPPAASAISAPAALAGAISPTAGARGGGGGGGSTYRPHPPFTSAVSSTSAAGGSGAGEAYEREIAARLATSAPSPSPATAALTAAAGGSGALSLATVPMKSLADYEIVSRKRYNTFPTIEGVDLTRMHDDAAKEVSSITTDLRSLSPPSNRNIAKAWVTIVYKDKTNKIQQAHSPFGLFSSGLAREYPWTTAHKDKILYHVNSFMTREEFINTIVNFASIPENFDILAPAIYCRPEYFKALEGNYRDRSKAEQMQEIFKLEGIWLAKCLYEASKTHETQLARVRELYKRIRVTGSKTGLEESQIKILEESNFKYNNRDIVEDPTRSDLYTFFAHSEQAALLCFARRYVINQLYGDVTKEGNKVVGIVINIVTQRDMSETCFRSIYINPLEDRDPSSVPLYVFVSGLELHEYQRKLEGKRLVSSRDPALGLTLGSGSPILMASRDRVFVRNIG